MLKIIVWFLLGFGCAVLLFAVVLWLVREELIKIVSQRYGYVHEDRPVTLLRDIDLYQGENLIGHLKKGARIDFHGHAKDSPMEYYVLTMGWEARGIERKNVFKLTPSADTFVEISIETKAKD